MSDISPKARVSVQGTFSATQANLITKIGRRHLILRNTGAQTVYVRLNDSAVATTSDFPIVAGLTVTLDCGPESLIYSVSTICAAGLATSVPYIGWN